MRAEGGDERENDQNFAEPQEHRNTLVKKIMKSTIQKAQCVIIAKMRQKEDGKFSSPS
jgi:hypothetical protein